MNMQPSLLAALPHAVLDMSTDFAPLFVGLVVGLCLGVLTFAFTLSVHDTYRPQQPVKPSEEHQAVPELPDAA